MDSEEHTTARFSTREEDVRGTLAGDGTLFQILVGATPTAASWRHSLSEIHEVQIGRGTAHSLARQAGTLAIQVDDEYMSGNHAVVARSAEGWVVRDAGSRNRTYVNGAVLAGPRRLADGDLVETGHTFFLFRARSVEAGAPLDLDSRSLAAPEEGLATFEPELAQRFDAMARIAATKVPVMLLGPSGAGKEVAARALHTLSRRSGRMVAVNCGGLAATLVEAELFGARRGAYSGATQDRLGLVRAADKGTLLLDEIGDLPAASQAALLRVLQEEEVLPVGDTQPIKVDVRLVCATHRDLDAMIAAGSFRHDLAARLAGVSVRLPPLTERREDLGLLVGSILERIAAPHPVTFTRKAARRLLLHDWPLNVRELERCLTAAVALAGDGPIDVKHLSETLREEEASGSVAPPVDEDKLRALLVSLLEEHRGNVSAVARKLGRGRMQIHRWLQRFAIDLEPFRR